MCPTSPTRRLLVLCAGLLTAWAPVLAGSTVWPASPSRLQLDTPHGTLHVITTEYVYESRLFVDTQPVSPEIRGRLDITYAYETPQSYYALVAVDTGDSACSHHFHWVALSSKGYQVSPRLGACTPLIRVEADAGVFTVHTPDPTDASRIVSFKYDGKTLHHQKGSVTQLPPLSESPTSVAP